MALSNDLLSLFAKATNDTAKPTTETTVYGTIVDSDGSMFVRLDGSEVLTPINTTASVKNGDRVTVMIKNHTATVTGNITSPSASSEAVGALSQQVTEFGKVVADVVTTEELQAEIARIDTVVADNVTIHKKLNAMEADIDNITAGEVTTEQLNAVKADVEKLSTDKLDAAIAEINYAKIDELNAVKADISELEADNVTIKQSLTATEADIETLTANDVTINEKLAANEASIETLEANNVTINEKLTANEASIESLEAEDATINGKLTALTAEVETLEAEAITTEYLDANYANIDFSNIGEAAMEKFYADSGLIKNVQIGDATITGELVGVTISGDLIKGNTIVAEKLVIKGEDGLYYKLNTDGITTEAEQTDYNSLNGSLIQAQSITATKISVDDLVAFDATIGGFNISETALYSGVKSSVGNTTTGVYLDKTGQLNVGDGTNYMRYYAKDGKYLLEISADSILFGTNKRSIEDIEVTSTAEGAPALIIDGTDANAIDISVDGEMSQTQYTGKNLLQNKGTSSTIAGLTFTVNADKSISVSGKTNSANNFNLGSGYFLSLKAGTYVLSGMENVTGGTEMSLRVYDGTTIYALNAGSKSKTFTLANDANVAVFVNFNTTGITYSGTIYPMIRLASNTDATYEPYCGGIPSPNPDYTQAIKATGDCGWFDGELLQGAYAYASGVFSKGNIYVCNKNKIPCKEGDVIKIVTTSDLVTNAGILWYANGVYLSPSYIQSTNWQATAPSGATEFAFDLGSANAITPSTAKHITVTINGKYAAIIDSVGKNIYDYTKGILGSTFHYENGTLGTGNDVYVSTVKCKGDQTYTIKHHLTQTDSTYWMRVACLDENYNFISRLVVTQASSATFTAPSNARYLEIAPDGNIRNYVQLEEGTVATDFVPHQSHREYIPLDEPLRDDDSIVCQNGVYGELRNNIEVIYDGSNDEAWTYEYAAGNYSRFQISLYPSPYYVNARSKYFTCTHFNTNFTTTSHNYGQAFIVNSRLYVYAYKAPADGVSADDAVAAWRAKLAADPMTVVYKLDTPTFTPFEDQTPFYRIKTFNNVTHISASDNANVKVTYYRNTDDGQNLANIKFLGDVIVEGSITTDKLDVDDLVAQDAFINAVSTNSVVVGAVNAINDLEVGVRNILLDSGKTVSTTDYRLTQYSVAKTVSTSTKYTLVVKANIPSTHYLDFYIGQTSFKDYRFTGTDQDEIYTAQLTSGTTTLTGQWIRFYNRLISGTGNGGATGTIYWACLYEGHVKAPMDWIAAPEDTESSISAVNTTANSALDAINNLDVGGRNMFKLSEINTACLSSYAVSNYVFKMVGNNSCGLYFDKSLFTPGVTYTLSYKFKKTAGTLSTIGGHMYGFTVINWYLDGVKQTSNYGNGVSIANDTTEHTVVITLRFNGGSSDDNLYIQINRGIATSVGAVTFDLWDVMLERGNVATDWKPAIEDWCANNDLTYIDGGKIYTGSITADKIAANSITADKLKVDDLSAISATIGKLTIDENGILTSEFLHDSLIEEGTLVDDYININYEYWAPSVNDYKVITGSTTLGFEDMVFKRTNGYTDPHSTISDGVRRYPVTSDNTTTKYLANGIKYDKSIYGYIENFGGLTRNVSGEIRFVDVIADTLTWARCELDFEWVSVNNLEVNGNITAKGYITNATDVKTSSGASLNNKLNSVVGTTDTSSTRTVTVTVPSGKYRTNTLSSGTTYYIFNSALLYLPHSNHNVGGPVYPHIISSVKVVNSTPTLVMSKFTMDGTDYSSHLSTLVINSASVDSSSNLVISLTLPTQLTSIMAFSSDITIS